MSSSAFLNEICNVLRRRVGSLFFLPEVSYAGSWVAERNFCQTLLFLHFLLSYQPSPTDFLCGQIVSLTFWSKSNHSSKRYKYLSFSSPYKKVHFYPPLMWLFLHLSFRYLVCLFDWISGTSSKYYEKLLTKNGNDKCIVERPKKISSASNNSRDQENNSGSNVFLTLSGLRKPKSKKPCVLH